MGRKAVDAPGAAAVGPYSHGVRARNVVFLSGQTPLDPTTGSLVTGSFADQVHQCFANLGAVLKAAGLTFDHVVKANVFLIDMKDFAAMNEVYETYFSEPYPARTTIGVASLPRGAAVEIEMIAEEPEA